MIIPVKCYTCGNILGSKYNTYQKYNTANKLLLQNNNIYLPNEISINDKTQTITTQDKKNKLQSFIQNKNDSKKPIESLILDKLGLKRYCCRRIMISHVGAL